MPVTSGEISRRTTNTVKVRASVGARRTERLAALVEELRGVGTIEACALDVTQRDSVQQFIERARATFGRLDVLVSNAGVMPLSPFATGRIDEWEQTIDVNVRGVLHGIHAALPLMLAQGGGQFVNVSSTASHHVWPGCGVYCASKFAVNAISEALRQEHDHIRVTLVSPGVTDSELAETTHEPGARAFLTEGQYSCAGRGRGRRLCSGSACQRRRQRVDRASHGERGLARYLVLGACLAVAAAAFFSFWASFWFLFLFLDFGDLSPMVTSCSPRGREPAATDVSSTLTRMAGCKWCHLAGRVDGAYVDLRPASA